MLPRLLVIAALFACAGPVSSQSLGELAAREKSRRAKATTPAKSLTDADLQAAAKDRAKEAEAASPDSPSAPAATASSRPVPGPSTAEPSARPTDSDASDAAKKSLGAQYKTQLLGAEADVKAAEQQLKTAEAQWSFVNSHTNDTDSLHYARSRLQGAKQALESARKRRDEIEDAARRAGIPPGYLR